MVDASPPRFGLVFGSPARDLRTKHRGSDSGRPGVRVDLDAGLEAIAADVLPRGPAESRRRRRLYALRAMERLGLLGENLGPTLSRRPGLRWLADERGARVDVLTELGRIRDPETFEAALAWVLANRPRTAEASAGLRRFRRRANPARRRGFGGAGPSLRPGLRGGLSGTRRGCGG